MSTLKADKILIFLMTPGPGQQCGDHRHKLHFRVSLLN